MRPRLSDAKATPAVAFCFFANHVLDGEAWARARLAHFAGRIVEFRAPLLPTVRTAITAQGRLETSHGEPDAVVLLGPKVSVSGEAQLAAELEALSRSLRWDVEEDLARIMGDVAAHRAAAAGAALWRWQKEAATRIGEALGAYAADEARLVVRRPECAVFAESVERLSRALDELEERIARFA